MKELEVGYNAWRRGETGETCGDTEDEYVKISRITYSDWSAYLSAVISRTSK